MENILETPYLNLWFKDGMLFGKYAEHIHIDLPIAKFCVEKRLGFTRNKPYACLIDGRGIRSVSKEAREYLATEGAVNLTACALLIGSVLTRTIGNIFLTVNKPQIPTQLFTDEAAAKKWLRQYTSAQLTA